MLYFYVKRVKIEKMKILDPKILTIKKFVSNGNLDIAIVELEQYIQEKSDVLRKELLRKIEKHQTGISARYSELKNQHKQGITDPEYFQRTFAKLIADFIDLLYQVSDIIEDTEELPVIERTMDGLVRIDSEKAMRLAIKEVKKAKLMKAIGMGRQDFAENPGENHVKDYYRAIEERFRESRNTNAPFIIKRVTQHLLKPTFQNHLKSCFEIIDEDKESGIRYDLVLYGDLKITYTYYIIRSVTNEASLFLTLNTENKDTDQIDNVLVFYTRNIEIIQKFNQHFDQFWRIESKVGRQISSLYDFDKYIPFNGPLYNQYNEIKHFIKRIPDDSVRMKHLKTEVDIFHRRLKGLDGCFMTYRHSDRSQRVTDCFMDYISD